MQIQGLKGFEILRFLHAKILNPGGPTPFFNFTSFVAVGNTPPATFHSFPSPLASSVLSWRLSMLSVYVQQLHSFCQFPQKERNIMMDKRYLDQAFFFCFPETKINRSIFISRYLYTSTKLDHISTHRKPIISIRYLFAAQKRYIECFICFFLLKNNLSAYP